MKTNKKGTLFIMFVSMLSLLSVSFPQRANAGGGVVQAVVQAVVASVVSVIDPTSVVSISPTATTAVIDYFSCNLNIFFGCESNGAGSGGAASSSSSGNVAAPAPTTTTGGGGATSGGFTLDVTVDGSASAISASGNSSHNVEWTTSGSPDQCDGSGIVGFSVKNPADGAHSKSNILISTSDTWFSVKCVKGSDVIVKTVEIKVLPYGSLSANPASILLDESRKVINAANPAPVKLSWNIKNADNCTKHSDDGKWTGSMVGLSNPATDNQTVQQETGKVKYWLTCKNSIGGEATINADDLVQTVCYEHSCVSSACSASSTKMNVNSYTEDCPLQSCTMGGNECSAKSAGNWREVTP